MQIRKNDSVMVISGRERGKTGKVLRVLSREGRGRYRKSQYGKAAQSAAGPSATWGYCRKGSCHSRFQHHDDV